jgi:hypothetical protein
MCQLSGIHCLVLLEQDDPAGLFKAAAFGSASLELLFQ